MAQHDHSGPRETPAATHGIVLTLKIPHSGENVLSSDYLLGQNHTFLSEKLKAFSEGVYIPIVTWRWTATVGLEVNAHAFLSWAEGI